MVALSGRFPMEHVNFCQYETAYQEKLKIKEKSTRSVIFNLCFKFFLSPFEYSGEYLSPFSVIELTQTSQCFNVKRRME